MLGPGGLAEEVHGGFRIARLPAQKVDGLALGIDGQVK
jgi:hypothetical protein